MLRCLDVTLEHRKEVDGVRPEIFVPTVRIEELERVLHSLESSAMPPVRMLRVLVQHGRDQSRGVRKSHRDGKAGSDHVDLPVALWNWGRHDSTLTRSRAAF